MDMIAWVLIGLAALMLGYQLHVMLAARRMHGRPVPAVGGDLGERIASMPVAVLYFTAEQCHNCRAMDPLVEALAKEYDNLVRIDAVEHLDIARRFQVRATPTIVRVRGGVIERVLLGKASEAKMRELLSA